MKRILLCCGAGMSTSLLVTKMLKAAKEKGIEAEIWAEPLEKLKDNIVKADIVMLGPQIKYAIKDVEKAAAEQGIPATVINMIETEVLRKFKEYHIRVRQRKF